MKAFVTGGTGFIGQRVIRKLLERGYDVHALARSPQSVAKVEKMGATAVWGDITDATSLKVGMKDSDVVYHIAAWYKIGSDDWDQAVKINVEGTRNVLRQAYESGVPKIVYTSTVGVFGDTKGALVDENYRFDGPFLSEYERTKWLAHYKVALPLIEEGAPIIIVMPGGVYGPGDTSFIAEFMQMFYQGLPALPGPESTFTYAHVEDVAEGHILAAEKGEIGESYILAGPAIPLGELIDFWATLTGRPAPSVHIPAAFLRPFAPMMDALGSVLPLPDLFSGEAVASLGATYMARADKARAELGWQTRPLQTGMLETLNWVAEKEGVGETAVAAEPQQQIAKIAAGTAVVLFVLWLFSRKKEK